MSTDPTNTLLANIKTSLQKALREGYLKDGNIPVRNVWDNLDGSDIQRHHLPIIQFDEIPTGDSTYAGDNLEVAPFAIQFVVWVDKGADPSKARTRARALRETLISSLHVERPFSLSGGARQGVSITRETDEYGLKFATGMGVIYRGTIMQPAGR